MKIAFRLDLEPRGQGRPRATVRGAHATVYRAGKDVSHEQTLAALAAQYRPQLPIEGPLSLEAVFVLARPAYLCKRSKRTGEPLRDAERRPHTGRPDLDNCIKGLLDALKSWWSSGDDAVVQSITASKWVAALGEAPHYHVCIRTP